MRKLNSKGKDGSGVALLCREEAERKVRRWNSQSLVPAGSMRKRTSSQEDLSAHRGSVEVQEKGEVQQRNIKGNKTEKHQRQCDSTHVLIESCEQTCALRMSNASLL